jgi:hypothetical protein
MVMQNSSFEQRMHRQSLEMAAHGKLSELGRLWKNLTNENSEYFVSGYSEADQSFDPAKSAFENVKAAAELREQMGDSSVVNQGGFVLGALARISELQGGKQ